MATQAENAATEYANWQLKLTEVSADPRPNYTLPGGPQVDYVGYVKFLSEMAAAARERMLAADGPFEVNSVAR
jgi:outer membrane protein assembly factor BamD (BamD/ComL family)